MRNTCARVFFVFFFHGRVSWFSYAIQLTREANQLLSVPGFALCAVVLQNLFKPYYWSSGYFTEFKIYLSIIGLQCRRSNKGRIPKMGKRFAHWSSAVKVGHQDRQGCVYFRRSLSHWYLNTPDRHQRCHFAVGQTLSTLNAFGKKKKKLLFLGSFL